MTGKMKRRLIALVAFTVLLLALGCQKPAPAPPTTPAPSPRQVLEAAGKGMEGLSSLSFALTHERGRTPLIPGIEATEIRGETALPDRVRLEVQALAPAFGAALQLRVVVVGEVGFMTDPLTGTWRAVAPTALPFNFVDLGETLREILSFIQNAEFVGNEFVDGVPARIVRGAIATDGLRSLIPPAAPGLIATLEVWVDQQRNLVLKARLAGRVVSQDSPEVIRLLTFSKFNQPVEVTLPQ